MNSLNLNPNAKTVLKTRYLLPGETPENLFERVATTIAEPEKDKDYWKDIFYSIMSSTKFLPNSPTLFNAGTGQGTLSACFVIPVQDNMSSIMHAATTSAMIQKFGGGIGYSFSNLRSRGKKITTTHGKACGSIAVLKMLSSLSDMITQGGKRHGANMGILGIDHPEIIDFIHMKDDDQTAQNFNISVAITNKFMKAVEANANWDLIDPHTKETIKTINAKQIWQEIINSAWKTGDPGIYFIDEANKYNPTPHLGKLESTNPCGEVPLLGNEACNLGSINLALFVNKDKTFDFDGLISLTKICTRFLDNVVTMNKFPVDEVAKAVEATRKIGLGVMGWHDALIQMDIPYESPKALALGEQLMQTIDTTAKETSIKLAEEKGPYPACRETTPIRNATRTCIAPTGSISAIAGCSSGIEPVFALAYVKNVLDGKQLHEVNPYLKQVLEENNLYSESIMEEIAQSGSIQDIKEIPDNYKTLFKAAMDIDYSTHIKMQAIFQKHTNLAVSKTINLPNSATKENIEQAYLLAYKEKCRGITVYRDGSKSQQVLEVSNKNHSKTKKENKQNNTPITEDNRPRPRPRTVTGITKRVRTGHGNTYVTINFDETGNPFEVFTTLGKAGSSDAAHLEAISRLISLCLRSGINSKAIIEQLKGITDLPVWDEGILIKSAPDAVAVALEQHTQGDSEETTKTKNALGSQISMWNNPKTNGHDIKKEVTTNEDNKNKIFLSPKCPECSESLVMQEGCATCITCGFTECGG
jgi:ribonucleoside-diphosphate reductase alpha chain